MVDYCRKDPGRRIQSPYTLVNDRLRSVFLRIRPYFAVLHGRVLRSYISVTVYGTIRSYTEKNGDRIRPPCTKAINDRLRPCLFDLGICHKLSEETYHDHDCSSN